MPDNENFEPMETMVLQIGTFFMVIPISSWREAKRLEHHPRDNGNAGQIGPFPEGRKAPRTESELSEGWKIDE